MAQINKDAAYKKIHTYILQMPSLSTTAAKVMQICSTSMPSPNDLNRVISLDPVLTGKVLQLINSAYYARRSTVTSLTRAIIILGINTIKNIVLSSAIVKCINSSPGENAVEMDFFWTHSIHVGVTAKLIAREMGIPPTEQELFFLAGLMHDLGKVPLIQQFSKIYSQIVKISINRQTDICLIENALLGFTHCTAGKMIAEKWQLGDSIREALAFHHNNRNKNKPNGEFAPIIELADIYSNACKADNQPINWDNLWDTISPSFMPLVEKIGISLDTLAEFNPTISEEINNAKTFLNLN
ncbi:MAG: HDOD domain-containing protein [Desulfobacterium sp.]